MVAVGSGVSGGSGEGATVGTDWASGAVGSAALSSGALSDSSPQAMTASVNSASSP